MASFLLPCVAITSLCLKTRMMMIHAPRGVTAGMSGDVRRFADLMDKLGDTMAETYAGKERAGGQTEITA